MSSYTILKLNPTTMDELAQTIPGFRRETSPDSEYWPADEPIYADWEMVFDPPLANWPIGDGSFRVLVGKAAVQRPIRTWRDSNNVPLPFTSRVKEINIIAIFFEYNGAQFVVLEGTYKSPKLCRVKSDLLIAQGLISARQGTYIENVGLTREYYFQSQFFYWLCYRFIRHKGVIPSEKSRITIRELSGYTGTSLKETQKTMGKGDRVTELLPTLAFLFSNDELSAIRMILHVDSESIEFELDRFGGIKIHSYTGDAFNGLDFEKMEVAEVVWMYTSVLPLLISEYDEAKESGDWNHRVYEDFVREVGIELVQRILSTAPSVAKAIKQLAATDE